MARGDESTKERVGPVVARLAGLALRGALVFSLMAAAALGALWAAKNWMHWQPPAPLSELLSEHEQRAEALLYAYDRDTGWKPNPYTQLHFRSRGPFLRGEPQDARLRTNSEGFFDREHYPQTRYYRIAFLGDSMVEAQQVDATQRFTDLLEGYLLTASAGAKAVETMNFGVSNLGMAQELGVARAYVGKYHPDEIWVMFDAANDITDSSPLFTPPPLGPTFAYSGGRITDLRFGFPDPPPVAEEMRRARYGKLTGTVPAAVLPYLYAREPDPAFDVALGETRACLGLLKKLADGIGARLVVVYVPAPAERDSAAWEAFVAAAGKRSRTPLHLDRDLGEERIGAMVRSEGAEFLSLRPLLLEKGPAEVMTGPHLTRMGHHWLAQFLAQRLLQGDCCAKPVTEGPKR